MRRSDEVKRLNVGHLWCFVLQAVMASDFALPRFRYLQKLLLVHGHWCYSRLANMILYFFYKNAVRRFYPQIFSDELFVPYSQFCPSVLFPQMFVALIFWYQFYCGFSGSAMIDQWYLIFFNLMFSAFPQLITGTLDKDVSAETLQKLPHLYVNGQNSEVQSCIKTQDHSFLKVFHSLSLQFKKKPI